MAAPDSGVTWNEAKPDNDSAANTIDDFNRHLQEAVRSRMALEHIWPAAHTGTSSAGQHTFLTLQPQAAAPTMAGTTAGGLYVSTAPHSLMFVASQAGTALGIIMDTGAVLQVATGGTQGGIVIASAANTGGVVFLAASAEGLVLLCHTVTGPPTWEKLDHGNIAGTEDADHVAYAVAAKASEHMERGIQSVAADTYIAVAFASNFSDTKYSVLLTQSQSGNAHLQPAYIGARAVSGFDLWNADDATRLVDWFVIGT